MTPCALRTVTTMASKGEFLSDLVVKDIDGDKWLLTAPLWYQQHGTLYIAPSGFVTDLASIPAVVFWRRKSGTHNEAAVIHDAGYAGQLIVDPHRVLSREDVDHLFRDGMEALGVSRWTRMVEFRVVRLCGWLPWNRYRKAEDAKT